MARTASIYTRVEPEIRQQAEEVLDQLGISMSSAVELFLRQVVLQQGLPFAVKLPRKSPLVYEDLNREQFDAELEKGMDDFRAGRVHTADAVEAEMNRLLSV